MAEIINGKAMSEIIRAELRERVNALKEKGKTPGLAVIIVGNDGASKIYVRNKHRACEEIGIYSEVYELPEETKQEDLLDIIEVLNNRDNIDGILVQLPLPSHISEKAVISAIDVKKDVDCFSDANVGRVMLGEKGFLPCTPAGIMELFHRYRIELEGKNCVVVGRSNIVGKPMALLLLRENATVTICHSKTRGLEEICRGADVLVSAIGKANFITKDMVKEGAVVIDVGMNRDSQGKLCGDVDFEGVSEKASYITPVPGGVGPMTITTLMQNTVHSAENSL